jgi:XTP/dITP diphosphohydrolase
MTRQIVLASNNAKKLAELRRILEPLVPGIEVLGLADFPAYDEPAETEPTFEGNALIKARACLAVTGLPSLADDSGLCVDALNGMPGVLSARWSGVPKQEGGDAANNRLLLSQLSEVPVERRTAQFRCVMALCTPDGRELVQEGVMAGRVLEGEHGRGDEGVRQRDVDQPGGELDDLEPGRSAAPADQPAEHGQDGAEGVHQGEQLGPGGAPAQTARRARRPRHGGDVVGGPGGVLVDLGQRREAHGRLTDAGRGPGSTRTGAAAGRWCRRPATGSPRRGP